MQRDRPAGRTDALVDSRRLEISQPDADSTKPLIPSEKGLGRWLPLWTCRRLTHRCAISEIPRDTLINFAVSQFQRADFYCYAHT